MDRIILFVLLAFLSFAPNASLAAQSDPETRCRPATSPRVAIDTVQADIRRWFGRCVRLSGIVYENRLLADRAAAIEAETAQDEDMRRSIVIWSVDGLDLRAGTRVEILGRVGSCTAHHEATNQYQQDHPDEIVWTSGYCHTSMENYLRPAAVRLLSYRAAERLTEADILVAGRQLVAAPTDLRPELVAAARAFAAAVIAGDEPGYFLLSDPDAALELERSNAQAIPEWVTERRAEAGLALRRLRALGSPFHSPGLIEGEQRVLIERSELQDTRPSQVTVCWCRGPDCAGRWPIMTVDADNDRSRPYACVHAGDFVFLRSRRAVHVSIDEEEDGLAEPRWPRRRETAASP